MYKATDFQTLGESNHTDKTHTITHCYHTDKTHTMSENLYGMYMGWRYDYGKMYMGWRYDYGYD